MDFREDILENFMLAMSDKQNHFERSNRKRVYVNFVQTCDAIPSATPPKLKSENTIIAEIKLLETTLVSISSQKDNFGKRNQSRLFQLESALVDIRLVIQTMFASVCIVFIVSNLNTFQQDV